MFGIPLGKLLLFGIILGGVFLYYRSSRSVRVCKDCGFTGKVIKTAKGSLLIEMVLWLCFLVPGVIYTLWRFSNRVYHCPSCHGQSLIPINSPVGIKLLQGEGHVSAAKGTDSK